MWLLLKVLAPELLAMALLLDQEMVQDQFLPGVLLQGSKDKQELVL